VRAAPPVSVQGTGGLTWRLMRATLAALAAAAQVAWVLGHAGLPAAWALPVIPAAALLAWPLTRSASVLLVWDGQRWSADGVTGTLGVMVDLGAGLLLQLRPEQRTLPPRWVAITGAEAGPAMHALRAAAYARAPGAVVAAGAGRDDLRLPR